MLEALIGYLNSDCGLSNKDIRSAVTREEYGAYRAELRSMQPSLRKVYGGGVDGVDLYLERLGKADRMHGRAQNEPRPKYGYKSLSHTSLYELAENAYEAALEALEEVVSMNPGVAAFFDRPVTFTVDRYPSLDPESMPRLHTSRSRFALHLVNTSESPIYRLKLETLQASLTELCSGVDAPAVRPNFEEDEDLGIDLLSPDAKPFDTSMLDDDL